MEVPKLEDYRKFMSTQIEGKTISTTNGFVRLLSRLVKDPKVGKQIVPIVPDESRTFGMEGMFREVGIYAHAGQLYEPVDSANSPTTKRLAMVRSWKKGSPKRDR